MPSKIRIQKPARHRPGKAPAQAVSSDSDDDGSSSNEATPPAPTPAPRVAPVEKPPIIEEEFETEEESGAGSAPEAGSESESEEEEEKEETSSSSDESAPAARKLLRPVFVKKANRTPIEPVDSAEAEHTRRKAEAEALIQEQLDRRAADLAAGKKAWDDDDDVQELEQIDDTDGVDPEGEYAKWRLRELQRVKRERDEIEKAERERAEVERRRNLSVTEREAEDREHMEKQRQEREGKGKAGYLKKYHHKGAFFQDDTKEAGLLQRDIMGASYVDEVQDRAVLPKYLQVRDETMVGRKGRQRHRDLRSEDTGRWGNIGDSGRRDQNGDSVEDERFRSDRDRAGGTGANAKPLGDRKRPGEEDERERKKSRVND